MSYLFDHLVHIDHYLMQFVLAYGTWAYAILFAIIFCETGCLITAFLPGDSLLFVAGMLAALPHPLLHGPYLFSLLMLASILGNQCNYLLGCFCRSRIKAVPNSRFIKPHYLQEAYLFYERYGGKAIILARFIPVIRTMVPFVAGISEMRMDRFLYYNILSAVLWIGSLLSIGYFFGNYSFIQNNLNWIIYLLIAFSLLGLMTGMFPKKNSQC